MLRTFPHILCGLGQERRDTEFAPTGEKGADGMGGRAKRAQRDGGRETLQLFRTAIVVDFEARPHANNRCAELSEKCQCACQLFAQSQPTPLSERHGHTKQSVQLRCPCATTRYQAHARA